MTMNLVTSSAKRCVLALVLGLVAVEATASTRIVVSVPDQKLVLVSDGQRLAEYKISTSRFGLSDQPRSYGTPLGLLEVAERIGTGLKPGAVLKSRRPTGEVLPVNAQGRDPIVTRILYLRGLEACNQNAYGRGIYIHGTPVERTLGKPDSYGCIRMRSEDVISLFDAVPVGTQVQIVNDRLRGVLPDVLAATQQPSAAPRIAEAADARKSKASVPAFQSPATQGTRTTTVVQVSTGGSKESRHYSTVSSLDLPSLGGVENLRDAQARDPEQRGGIGLSVSLW